MAKKTLMKGLLVVSMVAVATAACLLCVPQAQQLFARSNDPQQRASGLPLSPLVQRTPSGLKPARLTSDLTHIRQVAATKSITAYGKLPLPRALDTTLPALPLPTALLVAAAVKPSGDLPLPTLEEPVVAPKPVAVTHTLYDPFAGGPAPPRADRVRQAPTAPLPTWLTDEERQAWTRKLQRDQALRQPDANTDVIPIAELPSVHSAPATARISRFATTTAPPPREIPPPPGRHAGYITSKDGVVYALFEDAATHTTKALKVGDSYKGYTVKEIHADHVVLLDAESNQISLKLQPVETSPWQDPNAVTPDVQNPKRLNAPPLWGGK